MLIHVIIIIITIFISRYNIFISIIYLNVMDAGVVIKSATIEIS